jgi:hypothetical protein
MSATEKLVGQITHYYSHLHVGIIEITETGLVVGDRVHIKGKHTDFIQPVESLQVEHTDVSHADIGKSVGMRVLEKVREHDRVYVV